MKQKFQKYLSIYQGVRLPWLWLIAWLVISALAMQAEVKAVTITANIIDASSNAIRSNDLIRYVSYLLASGLLIIADICASRKTEETVDLGVRMKLWDKVMRLPSRYYDVDNGDELVSRVTSDAANAHVYFSMIVSSLSSIYGVVIIYIQLFAYHKTLASWALLVIPFTLILGALYCVMGYKSGVMMNRSMAGAVGYLAERVRNFRLIKAFGMEKDEAERGNRHYKKLFYAESFSGLCIAIIMLVMQIISCAFLIIAFVAGGQLVATGEITIGKLVGFYSLAGVMGIKMMQVFMNLGSVSQATGCLRKVAEIFEAEEEPEDGETAPAGQQDLRLENVHFSYSPDVPVLKGVSCTIPAGKVTAIIGTNGTGKSTIFKLLSRMYEPNEGAIYYGGTDISGYSLLSWRHKFALVAQDNPLMSGTVRDNILYGVEREVSDEELTAVAKAANIYDFVMEKPNGFLEDVGLGGGNFSGGQRQCIAIARAMLRNADCLLLDEATSNLDVLSAQAVQSALERLIEGRTAIVIAHTCAATTSASNIIVMRDGKVEDMGTPQELLQRNAYYRTFLRECDAPDGACPICFPHAD